MLRSRTPRVFSLLLATLLTVMVSTIATGQEQTPVAIDDSPTARLLVQRVLDQTEDNVGQAARGCKELLALYGSRLIPISEEHPDHFTTVRSRVEAILLAHPGLLERPQKKTQMNKTAFFFPVDCELAILDISSWRPGSTSSRRS